MRLNRFDRNKISQNFKPAKARPACGNCQHASASGMEYGIQCMKGGFFATTYSICDLYELKVAAPAPAAAAAPGAQA